MQLTGKKGMQLGCRGDSQGIIKRTKFNHTVKWYIHKPQSILDNITNGSFHLGQKASPSNLGNFVIPMDHRLKVKENRTIDKDLDLARELKKTVEDEVYGDTNCN